MTNRMQPGRRHLLMAALTATVWGKASAQTPAFPGKPIRLIVPAGPGSVQDVRSRQLADKLALVWGQPVIVENLPQGIGIIAIETLLRAAPDGHTLAMAPSGMLAVATHLIDLRFDPLRDIAPVTAIAYGPLMLTAHPQSPFDSVASLVRAAREQPGRINIGGYPTGSPAHLAVLQIERAAGIRLNHVPYTPGMQAVTDLLGGQIPLLLEYPGSIIPHVKSGRMRGLATASKQRLPALPDVPTFAEQGLQDVVNMAWQGIVVKAGTPRAVIDALHAGITRALAYPDLREAFSTAGVEMMGDGPDAFAAFIRSEHALWGKYIKDAGIRVTP